MFFSTEEIRILWLAGWSLLEQLGYHYPQDACCITDPQKLARRNEAAKLMFTCYRAGIDIFADTTAQEEHISPIRGDVPPAADRRPTKLPGNLQRAGCTQYAYIPPTALKDNPHTDQ